MEVKLLEGYENPDTVICQAARNDYYPGWVGEDEFVEVMKDIKPQDKDKDFADNLYSNAKPIDIKRVALIRRLMERGHWGVFEHPTLTVSIKGISRVCMAQLTRHRHMSFDVQSMRYVDFSDSNPVIPESLIDAEDGLLVNEADKTLESHYNTSVRIYETMVENGIPKEDARFFLPLAAKVNVVMTGNMRSYMHLFDIRHQANAQWEIRELSEILIEMCKERSPITFNLYEEYLHPRPNQLSP